MVWVSLCHQLRSKHSLLSIGSNSLRLSWHSGESDVLLNRASMSRFITVSWPFVCKHMRENKIHGVKWFGCFASQVVSRLGTTVSLRLRDEVECQIKEMGEVLDMLLCNTCTSGKSIPIPLVFPHWEPPFGLTVTCLSLLAMELSNLVSLVHKLSFRTWDINAKMTS